MQGLPSPKATSRYSCNSGSEAADRFPSRLKCVIITISLKGEKILLAKAIGVGGIWETTADGPGRI